MNTHTPGPWKAEGFGVWSCTPEGNRRVCVAEYDKGDGPYKIKGEKEAVSNARLIAAAPDMLAALQLALRYLEHPDVQAMPFALPASVPAGRVRAAIAKAEGVI